MWNITFKREKIIYEAEEVWKLLHTDQRLVFSRGHPWVSWHAFLQGCRPWIAQLHGSETRIEKRLLAAISELQYGFCLWWDKELGESSVIQGWGMLRVLSHHLCESDKENRLYSVRWAHPRGVFLEKRSKFVPKMCYWVESSLVLPRGNLHMDAVFDTRLLGSMVLWNIKVMRPRAIPATLPAARNILGEGLNSVETPLSGNSPEFKE